MPDVTTITSVGCTYVSKEYHRNGSPEKAQWLKSVPVKREVAIFVSAYSADSNPQGHLWGYNDVAGERRPLGLSAANNPPQVELLLAKFNEQKAPALWSGYPADYRRKPQDRPPVTTLKEWQRSGVIGKHEIARIRGGKKCSLSR